MLINFAQLPYRDKMRKANIEMAKTAKFLAAI